MGSGSDQSSSNSSVSNSQSVSDSISEYFSRAFSQNTSDSWNTSQSGTSESRLSTMQGDILQNREGIFNNYFMPQMSQALDESAAGSDAQKAQMEQTANAVNTAYDAGQKATEQTLAQQGIAGNANGVAAALKAANNRARSSSLAQAYFNQLSNANQNKTQLLQTMASLMPNTTNSAEYHSASQSQGASTSQGTSQSESAGSSTAHSESSSSSKSHGLGSGTSWGVLK